MDKLTLKLIKIVNATDKEAFEAFTEPDHLSRWFTTRAEAELVEGGRYSNADGDKGEYLSIDPPKRVVFTWDNEKHCPGTVVEVTFTGKEDGVVEISLEHAKLSSDVDLHDMNTGWSWALESLRSYLETGKPTPFEQWQKDNR